MIIIGAGLAGLLAANILQNRKPSIFEAQDKVPNNHSAVLRFRNGTIGDVIGMPFKQVRMIKTRIPWINPVADMLAYADKNGGVLRSDRSLPLETVIADRYIAPTDLIDRLAANASICLGMKVDFESGRIGGKEPSTAIPKGEMVISTMPMPILMKQLKYPYADQFHFSYRDGANLTGEIDACDAYVSLYFPDPAIPFSRVSITGNELIIEGHSEFTMTGKDILAKACRYLGVDPDRVTNTHVHKQAYSKIWPLVDDDARKEFIYWASSEYNVYSLGRYATWRPGLMLDDLLNDIRLIDAWARSGKYARKKAQAGVVK